MNAYAATSLAVIIVFVTIATAAPSDVSKQENRTNRAVSIITFTITVCGDGSCNYTNLADANRASNALLAPNVSAIFLVVGPGAYVIDAPLALAPYANITFNDATLVGTVPLWSNDTCQPTLTITGSTKFSTVSIYGNVTLRNVTVVVDMPANGVLQQYATITAVQDTILTESGPTANCSYAVVTIVSATWLQYGSVSIEAPLTAVHLLGVSMWYQYSTTTITASVLTPGAFVPAPPTMLLMQDCSSYTGTRPSSQFPRGSNLVITMYGGYGVRMTQRAGTLCSPTQRSVQGFGPGRSTIVNTGTIGYHDAVAASPYITEGPVIAGIYVDSYKVSTRTMWVYYDVVNITLGDDVTDGASRLYGIWFGNGSNMTMSQLDSLSITINAPNGALAAHAVHADGASMVQWQGLTPYLQTALATAHGPFNTTIGMGTSLSVTVASGSAGPASNGTSLAAIYVSGASSLVWVPPTPPLDFSPLYMWQSVAPLTLGFGPITVGITGNGHAQGALFVVADNASSADCVWYTPSVSLRIDSGAPDAAPLAILSAADPSATSFRSSYAVRVQRSAYSAVIIDDDAASVPELTLIAADLDGLALSAANQPASVTTRTVKLVSPFVGTVTGSTVLSMSGTTVSLYLVVSSPVNVTTQVPYVFDADGLLAGLWTPSTFVSAHTMATAPQFTIPAGSNRSLPLAFMLSSLAPQNVTVRTTRLCLSLLPPVNALAQPGLATVMASNCSYYNTSASVPSGIALDPDAACVVLTMDPLPIAINDTVLPYALQVPNATVAALAMAPATAANTTSHVFDEAASVTFDLGTVREIGPYDGALTGDKIVRDVRLQGTWQIVTNPPAIVTRGALYELVFCANNLGTLGDASVAPSVCIYAAAFNDTIEGDFDGVPFVSDPTMLKVSMRITNWPWIDRGNRLQLAIAMSPLSLSWTSMPDVDAAGTTTYTFAGQHGSTVASTVRISASALVDGIFTASAVNTLVDATGALAVTLPPFNVSLVYDPGTIPISLFCFCPNEMVQTIYSCFLHIDLGVLLTGQRAGAGGSDWQTLGIAVGVSVPIAIIGIVVVTTAIIGTVWWRRRQLLKQVGGAVSFDPRPSDPQAALEDVL